MLKINGQVGKEKEKSKKEPEKKTPISTPCSDIPSHVPKHIILEIQKLQRDFFNDFPKVRSHQPLQYYEGTDNKIRCKANNKIDTVVYNHNNYGYRCPDFNELADVKILSLGCSWVYGMGLNKKHLYHEIVAKNIRKTGKTVVNWNLGIGGKSNDYITRMLHIAMDKLNPNIVLINFTHLSRREYFSFEGDCIAYTPNLIKNSHLPRKHRTCVKNLLNLTSDHDNFKNFWHNFQSVKAALQNTHWCYSFTDEPLLDDEHSAGRFLKLDLARDLIHPGIESHRVMAEIYWDKLSKIY